MLQLPFQELFETYKPAQNTLSEPGLGALGNTQIHTVYNVQFIYQSMVVTRDPTSSLKTPARWKCLGFLVQSIATQVEGANTGSPSWRFQLHLGSNFWGPRRERNLYQFMRRISVQLGWLKTFLGGKCGYKNLSTKVFWCLFRSFIIISPYHHHHHSFHGIWFNQVFITRSNAGHYESKLPAMCSTRDSYYTCLSHQLGD